MYVWCMKLYPVKLINSRSNDEFNYKHEHSIDAIPFRE